MLLFIRVLCWGNLVVWALGACIAGSVGAGY